MTRIGTLLAGLPLALASLLFVNSAYAQNAHSWVSSTGSGTFCTRAAPCATFKIAMTATNAGGVISVLDSGAADNAEQITITKSLIIRAEAADSGLTTSASAGALVTIAAGPNDVVALEGLRLSGGGIYLNSAGHLHVTGCVITNEDVAGEAGIRFHPNSPAKLSVTDTAIYNVGSGTGGGIVINPASGGSAQVALERVTVNGNAFGIVADGTGSTAGINMTIADSMIANNIKDGILATTPGGGSPIGVLVTNTKSVNNAFGIRSIGSNVTVRAEGSKIAGNGAGLSFSGGGALLTAGNNLVRANGSDGVFSGPVALQ
jgi:hypothetical protein